MVWNNLKQVIRFINVLIVLSDRPAEYIKLEEIELHQTPFVGKDMDNAKVWSGINVQQGKQQGEQGEAWWLVMIQSQTPDGECGSHPTQQLKNSSIQS